MRQFFMMLAAVLFISTTALAQEKNDNRKQEMIKHRTERMVKAYNLNDKQAKQLQELNTKYADMMRPMHRHGGPGHHGMRDQRPEPPKDMKGEKPEPPKGDMKEMREKMEKDMKAYDEELQKIMTPEQYKNYKADMEKRRKEGPHGPRGQRGPRPENPND